MKHFANILVYSDGSRSSQNALERAGDLAMRNNGRVTLCGVLAEWPEPIPQLARLQQLASAALTKQLEALAAPLRERGVAINVSVLTGPVFIALIQDVLQNHRDLVMLTAEGEGTARSPLFGSTTMHVLRKCPCPVWVFKPGAPKRFRRIVAAVDLVRGDPARAGLNTRIMELATSLAAMDDAEVHIVHAWEFPHEDRLRRVGALPKAQLNRMVKETETEHRHQLDELLEHFPMTGVRHRTHLLKWPAAVAIDHVARMHRADLIIMGTVGRTGLAGFFIGNTAETVLRESRCSVLAVKPVGFVSPVAPPVASRAAGA